MLRKLYILCISMLACIQANAGEALVPTITPSFFTHNTAITVAYDVTGTSLANLTDAYIWVWIPDSNIDAKYNVNPASSNTALSNNAKFIKSIVGGRTIFTITFTPSSFFSSSIAAASRIGILLKGNDWSNGQTNDYVSSFWDGTSYVLRLVSPTSNPLIVDTGQSFDIKAETSFSSDFELFIDGASVATGNGVSFSYTHTVLETEGLIEMQLVATTGTETKEEIFGYSLRKVSPIAARPSGIVPGINYSSDNTKATLCLWAPGKKSVFVLGEFNNWEKSETSILNRDGEFFWIELTGLTSGQEYAFRYLVDEAILVADPYAEKILDPDDQYIPNTTYPDLKAFPSVAKTSNWYENRLAVLQTNQVPYEWQTTDFDRPKQEELVIYEILLRDFFDDQHRNYNTLVDTLGYLKSLGINAIELMPIMEFNGNEGWGYNPTFMFAPDKYYGTKDDLKTLIDACHEIGIAVIFDIAMNHHDVPNPYVSMYFDYNLFQPTANNPWFNVTAKHPYNVFFDMNHASSYTMTYLDSVNHYWLNEYHIDGYRFDLSKGFTQKNTGGDVGAWSVYDPSRIFILKRMADKIWSTNPDAYIILEHFADNSEEKELAEYRSAEGKGMLLWGNINHAYNQNTMGYGSNSDISSILAENRGWSTPHLIGYMESHDEERLMFKNITYGVETVDYSVRNLNTALYRMHAAGVMFYLLPGPKMAWQFGELGYDQSINRCSDGSVDPDCRLSEKPEVWNYQNDFNRDALFNQTADLLRLRNTYSVFREGDAVISGGSSLQKQVTIKNNPYTASPSDESQMNVQLVANFDVTAKEVTITFPHSGEWYDYYRGGNSISVTGSTYVTTLGPGEARLFTDYPIEYLITSIEGELTSMAINVYPNPVVDKFSIKADAKEIQNLRLLSLSGEPVNISKFDSDTWEISSLPSGMYIVEVSMNSRVYRTKIIKK